MQIDYDVGDVVVCVDASFQGGSELNRRHLSLIKQGSFYRVAGINDRGGVAIAGVPYPYIPGKVKGYKVGRFRKLPKADSEFTEQMRKLKPHKQKVDA